MKIDDKVKEAADIYLESNNGHTCSSYNSFIAGASFVKDIWDKSVYQDVGPELSELRYQLIAAKEAFNEIVSLYATYPDKRPSDSSLPGISRLNHAIAVSREALKKMEKIQND